MDIEEAQRRKQEVENTILQALREFELETGVEVHRIRVRELETVDAGTTIQSITVETRL